MISTPALSKLNNTKNKLAIIEIGIIIMFFLYYILPAASASFHFIIPVILGLAYIFSCLLTKPLPIEVIKYLSIILFLAILYTLLTDISTISAQSNIGWLQFASKFYQLFMMFLPLFILYRVQSCATKKQKIALLVIGYILVCYVMFITLRELNINPNITRHWEDFAENAEENIGGYYFVYAIPITISICTFVVFKLKTVFLKFVAVCLIIFQFYFLLVSQYTLSIIAAVIGICVSLFINTEKLQNKVFVVVGGIIFIALIPAILRYAISNVPSKQMALRLQEIYTFFSSNSPMGYNLNGRLTLYKKAILAFFQSPIWGNRSLDFNGHATFLNVLADLGILGGIPLYYLYLHAKKIVSILISDSSNYFFPSFLVLMITGFVNPLETALPLMVTIWFLVPLTIAVFNTKGEPKDETSLEN